MVKNLSANAGDKSCRVNPWIAQSLDWEDPMEKGMAAHLEYSCLENSMDRGAWQATVHGVAESDMTE